MKKEIFVSSGYKVYEQRNAIYSTTDIGSYYINADKYRELLRFSITDGDFIVSCSGTIGCIYRLPMKSPEGVINQALLKITLDPAKIDAGLFLQYFRSEYFQKSIIDDTQGGAMKNLVGMDKFRKALFVIPSDPKEQHTIAAALADVDGYIVALERLIAKKRNIKKGAMQELLTGKRRLPGFCGEWVSCDLPEVFIKGDGIKIGPFGSQLKKEYLIQNGEYRVYGQENVYQNDFSFGSRYLTHERFVELQSCEIKPGDFVISTMGTIGKCTIVPQNIRVGIMDSHLIRLRIDERKMLPLYLLHLFSSDYNYLENQTSRLSVGGIMDGLSTKIVLSLKIVYPESVAEQTTIAAILSDMDTEIDALMAKLNKVRYIKQGMMQELLTGRIRLLEQDTLEQSEGERDATILCALVNAFGTPEYPFTAFDAQKFPYLFHRHVEGFAKGYGEFAAGPYNPSYRHETARPIALERRYIREHTSQYKGFIVDTNAEEALTSFSQWYDAESLLWMEQFRYIPKRKEELELLTTTDMAMMKILSKGGSVHLRSVKEHIKKSPAWKEKLNRPIFSDSNIARAIEWSHRLFGTEVATDAED